jgi:hypothetical protein
VLHEQLQYVLDAPLRELVPSFTAVVLACVPRQMASLLADHILAGTEKRGLLVCLHHVYRVCQVTGLEGDRRQYFAMLSRSGPRFACLAPRSCPADEAIAFTAPPLALRHASGSIRMNADV